MRSRNWCLNGYNALKVVTYSQQSRCLLAPVALQRVNS